MILMKGKRCMFEEFKKIFIGKISLSIFSTNALDCCEYWKI
jgi:hypothetical protein